MFKNFSHLLRVVVAVVAVGALATAPVAFSGTAQAAQAPRVTLKTSAHTVKTTGSFTLTARTVGLAKLDRRSGTKVELQQKLSGRWRDLMRFPNHAGGHLRLHGQKGYYRFRAVLEEQGSTVDVSPVVAVRVTAPKPAHTAPGGGSQSTHSCTQTSSGSCIRGGEFCSQSMYGHTGYDANGRSWVCTGDHTHPHWE